MTEAPAIEPRNVHEAIVAVMRNVGYVQKVQPDRKGGGGLNYSFASEADLIAALRPHMVAVGLTFAPVEMARLSDVEFTSAKGTAGHRVVIACTWDFCHAPSDTHLRVVSQGEGMDYGDKASNKAMTVALKYALRQTFIIETGDDPDTTPSEEFQRAAERKGYAVPPGNGKVRDWTAVAPRFAKLLKAEKIIPETAVVKHVMAFLNLSPFGPDVQDADLMTWGHIYRAIRDGDDDLGAHEAADLATHEYFSPADEKDKPVPPY